MNLEATDKVLDNYICSNSNEQNRKLLCSNVSLMFDQTSFYVVNIKCFESKTNSSERHQSIYFWDHEKKGEFKNS